MKKLIFFIFVFVLISAVIVFWKLESKPFILSEDMGMGAVYAKKGNLANRDEVFNSIVRFTPSQMNLINSVKPSELLGFRCSDEFIRTNQGIYILKNIKTSEHYKRIVKNNEFIEFMRNKEKTLPLGKKILTAKVCETENLDVYLFYSIGRYNSHNVDNSTILQTIYDSSDNETVLQKFPDGRYFQSKTLTIDTSNNYLNCNNIFQYLKNNSIYLLCGKEESKESDYYIYAVNVKTNAKITVGECLNNYQRDLVTKCN